jgi:hypothetical protein
VILVVVRGIPAAARARSAVRAETASDRLSGLLVLAVRGLPADRSEWGTAMCAELAGVRGSRARWVFGLGCVRTALALRLRARVLGRDRGGNGVRAFVIAGTAGALALSLYGLERYPALRAGSGAWAALAALAVILLGYAALALSLTRGAGAEALVARGAGVAGGVLVGAAWLAIIVPGAFPKALFAVPLAASLLVPAAVATLVGRSTGCRRAGTDAALWGGLVGALLAFVVWVSATYASDGRPYDAQLVRDFHHSGAHDLAAYAVGDALGSAIGLLVIIPVVAVALGSLGARLARASV